MPFYRLFICLAWGPVALLLLLRVLRGQERLGDWAQRIGIAPGRAAGRHVWLHAASNGELLSALPVLKAYRAERPDLKLLVTTNSLTGRDLARKWDLPGLTVRLAPLDTRWAAVLMRQLYHVQAHVLLESEFWPNRILAMSAKGLPVFAVGARLSRDTAQTWRRVSTLAARVLERLTYVSPQDEGTRRRLMHLGLTSRQLGPVLDLKAFYRPPPELMPDETLKKAFARDRTWLAASTHPGEEEIVFQAHLNLLKIDPEARLIVAPRHPKRGPQVSTLARKSGLESALRSAGDPPRAKAVYIADTLGEMPLWYQLAGTTFIAGTLVDKGGHTPFEPAVFDSTLLHGPDIANFTTIFRRLDVSGAAIQVHSAEDLTRVLIQTRDPDRRDAMRRMAHDQLDHPSGLDTVMAKLLANMAA